MSLIQLKIAVVAVTIILRMMKIIPHSNSSVRYLRETKIERTFMEIRYAEEARNIKWFLQIIKP